MAKPKRVLQEKYKSGSLLDAKTVVSLINTNIETVSVDMLERGKYDNGDEYISVKIYIPK